MKNTSNRLDTSENLLIIFSILALGTNPLISRFSKTAALVLSILFGIIAAGLFVYVIWIRSKKPALAERILVTVGTVLLLMILFWTSDKRTEVFFILLLFWGLTIAVFVIDIRQSDDLSPISGLLVLFTMLSMVLSPSRICHFTNGFFQQKFWYCSIAIAALLLVIFRFLRTVLKVERTSKISKKHNHLKSYREAERFGKKLRIVMVIVTFLILVFLSYTSLVAVNYSLDDSEAQVMYVPIVDKRYSNGVGRHRSSYHAFIVDYEGDREWIYVSETEYEQYEEGNFLPIYFHEGALGEPYFS